MELMSNLGHITETEAKDNKQKKFHTIPWKTRSLRQIWQTLKVRFVFTALCQESVHSNILRDDLDIKH